MAKKLTEQRVLEGLIDAHIKNLEYMINTGAEKTSVSVFAESAQITVYMTRYKLLENSPKFWDYTGRIGKF